MTRLESLQATLAAEHAAVHLYAVLGAQTSQSAQPDLYDALVDAYRHHRARRDQLVALVTDTGAQPVAAAPAYELPPLGDVARVRSAAVDLEDSCAATYAAMVATTSGSTRRWAVTALTDSAVRLVGLGAAPEPFPGAPDLGPTGG